MPITPEEAKSRTAKNDAVVMDVCERIDKKLSNEFDPDGATSFHIYPYDMMTTRQVELVRSEYQALGWQITIEMCSEPEYYKFGEGKTNGSYFIEMSPDRREVDSE
jgi:hypothetical protein